MEVCDITGGTDKDDPQEKEMQKGKMVVSGGLTNSCEKCFCEPGNWDLMAKKKKKKYFPPVKAG